MLLVQKGYIAALPLNKHSECSSPNNVCTVLFRIALLEMYSSGLRVVSETLSRQHLVQRSFKIWNVK